MSEGQSLMYAVGIWLSPWFRFRICNLIVSNINVLKRALPLGLISFRNLLRGSVRFKKVAVDQCWRTNVAMEYCDLLCMWLDDYVFSMVHIFSEFWTWNFSWFICRSLVQTRTHLGGWLDRSLVRVWRWFHGGIASYGSDAMSLIFIVWF